MLMSILVVAGECFGRLLGSFLVNEAPPPASAHAGGSKQAARALPKGSLRLLCACVLCGGLERENSLFYARRFFVATLERKNGFNPARNVCWAE